MRSVAAAGLFLACLAIAAASSLRAEEKKDEEPKVSVLTANPLGVVPGKTMKVVLRGRKLDSVESVATGDVSAEVKIVEKKSAAPPNKELIKRLGDTQLELEITLPSDSPATVLPLVFTSPAGTSEPFSLPASPAESTVVEVEPNDGYAQAQPIEPGKVVLGAIHDAKNVDVYAFAGTAGRTVVVEIAAQRLGSGLDAIVTLATRSGRFVASNDDANGSKDSRLEATLPADGDYVIVVQDALDAGGQAYGYRLSAAVAP